MATDARFQGPKNVNPVNSAGSWQPKKWHDVYASQEVDNYDRFIEIATMGHGRALDAICQMMDQPRTLPLHILEMGTGTGLLTRRILEQFPLAEVFGVDGSERMLNMARQKLEAFDRRFIGVQSTFESCPWDAIPKAKFDAVVSAFSLHHMDHAAYPDFFNSLWKVLKVGGQVTIADYTRSRFDRLQERYEDIWAETRTRQTNQAFGLALSKNEVRAQNDARHQLEGDNPAPVEDLLRWLSEAGFEETECYWKHFCYCVFGGKK
ncbi:MAG: class I SAM-dependent methyltransferase [Elusimicrobia bacterium]|nr:class I SAM-dependent methyltransferase [Elusimicrobiota bacterium]